MAGDRPRPGIRPGLVFLASCLLFVVAVVWLLGLQKARLKREIDVLVHSNLDIHVENRAKEISAQIADTRSTLQAAASVVNIAGISPQHERFRELLQRVDAIDGAKSLVYITMEDLPASNLSPYAERLARGESIVTRVIYSDPLGGYYYYICVPVWSNGEITGVLSARMRAADLVRLEPDGVNYTDVRTCLVTSGGRLAFVDSKESQASDNILINMRKAGLSGADVAGIANALRAAGGRSNYQFLRKGSVYFVSIAEIGYNDWHLVAFLRGPDVVARWDSMLKSVLHTSTALVLLTTGACCVIYAMLLADRRMLEREQRRYAMLAQFSDTVLFEYNRETDTVEFTSNALMRLCLEGASLAGISHRDQALKLFHPDDQDKVREIFFDRKIEGILYYTELRIKSQSGHFLWYGCQYRVLEDAHKGLSLVVGKLVDITDQRSREQKLEENARRDVLTGTYNKAGEDMIDELLVEHPQGVLMMLDVDKLKEINDTYGHNTGDYALAKLGALLNETFRKEDIVARVGGDEFVAFLPGPLDYMAVKERIDEMLSSIRAISIGEHGNILSASAGLAFAPKDGTTYQELYIAADKAMYIEKQKRRLR